MVLELKHRAKGKSIKLWCAHYTISLWTDELREIVHVVIAKLFKSDNLWRESQEMTTNTSSTHSNKIAFLERQKSIWEPLMDLITLPY